MLANAYFVNIPTSGGGDARGDDFPVIEENRTSSLYIKRNFFPFEQICEVYVTGSMTVKQLKQQILNRTSYIKKNFDLFYNGGLLQDNRQLWTYYIRCDGQLFLKTI